MLLLVLTGGGCSERAPAPTEAVLALQPLLGEVDPTSWVRIYDPNRAWNGYLLALAHSRIPILVDMNGRIVHAWPEARVRSRIRLLENGSLLGIGFGRAVVEYDWDGGQTWSHDFGEMLPHHDFLRLENGNTLAILLTADRLSDVVVEIDRQGNTVWKWRAETHFGKMDHHINSVREIPENDWFDRGDERFRPGNLLLSVRNLDRVVVIDRRSGEVVWSFGRELDLQHEAVMIARGMPGAGNVMIFNNRYDSFWLDRRSAVTEIDPLSKKTVWEFMSDGFFSATVGVEQPLPNGNVLITSSRGGRVFEVDRDGRTVWEWTPPFEPVRPHRYAPDHAPQLAALSTADPRPVRPPPGYRHIDAGAYRFARRGWRREVKLGGKKIQVLKKNDACGRILLPTDGTLQAAFGIDSARIRAAGRTSYAARFVLLLRSPDDGAEVELLEQVLDLETAAWQERQISLAEFAHQKVELCVVVEELGAPNSPTEQFAYWVQPTIVAGGQPKAAPAAPPDLTTEEIEARRQHLEALGYVD